MIKQAFQHAELRDANDNIIQQGAYGKRSALANSTNDGWIDHVMNNLEVLHDTQENDMATKEYADTAAADAAAGLVASAPSTLDTLAELAAALGDDPNFATTIVTLIDTKCAQAKAEAMLAAHPVGSYYESADSTSPATLFGGTWQEQIPDGELVGAVASFSGNNTLPEGWLLCNGSAVSRETYAALFSVIGTTYGSGNGSTTFNLPNLADKFIQGNATAGTVKAAGLPNLSGSVYVLSSDAYSAKIMPIGNNSVFAGGTSTSTPMFKHMDSGGMPSSGTYNQLAFNASLHNSIYGSSTTVQPPAVTMKFAIYSGVVSKKLWLRTV